MIGWVKNQSFSPSKRYQSRGIGPHHPTTLFSLHQINLVWKSHLLAQRRNTPPVYPSGIRLINSVIEILLLFSWLMLLFDKSCLEEVWLYWAGFSETAVFSIWGSDLSHGYVWLEWRGGMRVCFLLFFVVFCWLVASMTVKENNVWENIVGYLWIYAPFKALKGIYYFELLSVLINFLDDLTEFFLSDVIYLDSFIYVFFGEMMLITHTII